ncbi:maltoporin LamB [Vibrio sp. 10N.261.52.C2]|uniref:maltoporin LamB n=1 Tax=Vibrio sp. 10N.261.52.C2 TaxID=3229681 RepID=UPI0035535A56
MKKVSLIAAAVATSLAAGSAFAVDFSGYVRSGIGLSGNDGENLGYEKSKLGRLGNENDTFFEVGLGQELYNEDGVSFYLDSLIAHAVDGDNDWEASDSALRVINVQAKGLIKSDADATMWVGKRYYQRRDVHITDFYYLNTSSGAGVGVENLSLGGGKLSTALITDEGSQAGAATYGYVAGNNKVDPDQDPDQVWAQTGYGSEDVSAYILDVRYAGIDLWSDASLELAAAYNFAHEKKDQTAVGDDGALLSAIVHQGLDNGFNQTVFQYGTNSYAAQMPGLGGGNNYDRSGANNDADGFRIINWGVVGMGSNWEVGHQIMFASASDVGTSDSFKNNYDSVTGAYVDTTAVAGTKFDHTLANIVVRPEYKWDNNMKTIFEVGYYAEEKDNVDYAASKYTVAQAWGAGSSFWARPEIRLFASYFVDHEGTAFSGEDSEVSIGAQFEAWW